MAQARTEYFLELYKRLETVAAALLRDKKRGSVVFHLANMPRFSHWKNDLDYCREVRNLLQHEVKINGEYAVEPSEQMVKFLEQVIHRLEYPALAIDHATKRSDILSAKLHDRLLPIMREMQKRALSHVPILEDEVVVGVFSENTVFQSLLDNTCIPVNEETLVSAFRAYLPISRHLGHRFAFIPENITLADAREIFDNAYDRNKKLRTLFITKNGKAKEPLLALMTPYDVLDRP